MRYEFFSPATEKYGRLANLDISPSFNEVAVVTPGSTSPYGGTFPDSLIRPDRNNLAPRAGFAWKVQGRAKLTIRSGYGISYNQGVYNQFASRLAGQPPFAQTFSTNTSTTNVLTLATGLVAIPANKTVTNTFAVNPNYVAAYAQTWNVSIQRDLSPATVLEVFYTGTKGTHLDIQRMPNRAAPGSPLTSEQRLAIGNATGFTYDSSDGNSILHSGQVRLNRRFRNNFSGNLQYTFAKSIDNSTTFGGAGNSVAQDDRNLAAERGLSSFDRRQVLTASYMLSSPVGGRNAMFQSHAIVQKALKDWNLSGAITMQTGTPLTARVLGNQSDTGGTGAIGSGRADATGLPIDAGSGYFNLAAFALPPSGRYGNAARNTIPGPGSFVANLSLSRTINLAEQRRRMDIRIDANNFLNHVNISNIGTVLNAINYGLPTSAGAMRSISATIRFNF